MITRDKEDTGKFRNGITRFFSELDYVQLAALLFLSGIGLLFIYSTGIQVGTPEAESFFSKQLYWCGGGLILYFIFSSIDYRKGYFRILSILAYFFTLILLIMTILHGVKVYGATRWLNIGPFRLQASEFAKLTLTLALSVLFSAPFFQVNNFFSIALSIGILLPPLILTALEPDLGSAAIYLPIYMTILFCAGLKKRVIFVTIALIFATGAILTFGEVSGKYTVLKDYQRNRIKIFFRPEMDRTGLGHNAYQSRLAVGAGGVTGKGISEGTQNTLGFLPQTVSNNDFIFSVIAEDTGFVGCLLLLFGYLLLFYAIFRTAFMAQDSLGRFIAVGVGAMIFFHMFVNIGMSVGIAPITGLSLPFVSYGGSFIIMGMIALGVVQSVYSKNLKNNLY